MNAELPLNGPVSAVTEHEEPIEQAFDWLTDDSVVIKAQPATAVYMNALGEAVIRQESDGGLSEDVVIVIRPENINALGIALDEIQHQWEDRK